MNVEVKKINEIKRELKFEIQKDRVLKTFDEVYKEIGKFAKVKGYRPGKVPRHVLEASHGSVAREEVIKKLVPEAYHEGIENEKLKPIDMPMIEGVELKNGILTFIAKLDLKPEVNIKDYKGLKVKRKDDKVTDEEINNTLDYIKQGQGKNKEDVLDDGFAREMGYPNLDEFKKALSKQLELDKDRHNRMDVENQIVEQLIKKTKFTLPQSLVTKQLEKRVEESKQRLQKQGMPVEEIQKREEEIRKELKEAVEKDIKLYLILDKIAELENIQVNEGESVPAKTMAFLLKEAKWET
ncbi:MAG: hypothetical protein H6755_00515 [Candidatus Omnitrophica bacterium]|nr:hypothetical protein [Candidatus Omnitrophota bacterium]MCB9746870.1 hypothetical protein [Candidatus Omnitrophota bacterium]